MSAPNNGHALFSPSSAHRWLHCFASVAMESIVARDEGDTTHADEGTAAHFLAEWCLTHDKPAAEFIGREIVLWSHPESDSSGVDFHDNLPVPAPIIIRNQFVVDAEMAEHVQTYIDTVLQYQGEDGERFVEQRLSISAITGEENAFGTSDCVIVRGDEIIVIDLKYGHGVRVSAERNEQLSIYALAALAEYELIYDIKRARLVISQPRVSKAPSEWDVSVEKLRLFGERVRTRADNCRAVLELPREQWAEYCTPALGEDGKQCQFCKAKAQCDGLAKLVGETVIGDFDVLTDPAPITKEQTPVPTGAERLAACYGKVKLIRAWCDAIEQAVNASLSAGEEVPGYKLVQGRQGDRAWADAAAVETMMKSMRLSKDEMYSFKLISPTQAEKLLAKEAPRKWKKLAEHITRSDGRPAVAPVSDPRPALVVKPVADDFTETADDLI